MFAFFLSCADWPGPKTLPVTMALISFFSFMAFLQTATRV